MRKLIKTHRSTLLIGSLVLCLASCGGSGSGNNTPTPGPGPGPDPDPGPQDGTGLLKSAASEAEFLGSLKSGIASQTQVADSTTGDFEAGGPPVPAADAAPGDSFSSTYTLEANVGEYDVVKYDGEHLYIARQLGYNCCYFIDQPLAEVAADFAPFPEPQANATIRILSTDTPSATANQVSEIELPEGENLLGMFLADDRLSAITSEQYYSPYGDVWLEGYFWSEANTGLKIYNVSDPLNAVLDWDISFQGGLAESRRIGETLYMVTRHQISPVGYSYYATSPEEVNSNQIILDALSIEDVTPQVTINGNVKNLFSTEDCLISNDASSDRASSVITSITRIPLGNPESMTTLCYPESAYGVYVTEQSIYVSDVRYDSGLDENRTRIHKFAVSTTGTEYVGSGEVAGALWGSGQLDFRINEYQGQLRLVTSQFTSDADDRVDHILHILEESPAEQALVSVSQLPNATRPAEIGKPNEDLYGVRFQADRAYLVTFERIDPLYVLDLRDSSDPQIAGELEVTGFSDFLHPVNENLLLGLGVDGSKAKLELFNIADISNPVSQGVIELQPEASWSWSAAQYDRHAFTYLADVNAPAIGEGTDRFAIPVESSTGNAYEVALLEFEITGKATPDIASLDEVGKVVAAAGSGDYRGEPRSVINGNAVFFISGSEVWSAFWGETGAEAGPQ